MTVSIWDLNSIVLNHCTRFYGIASLALEDWFASNHKESGDMIGLAGNLLWAQSPYISSNKAEEEFLGTLGALTASLGPDAVKGEEKLGEILTRAIKDAEVQHRSKIDHVLERLFGELRAEGLMDASPQAINQWTWNRMFPDYSYELSSIELRAAFRNRLDRLTSTQ